MLDFRGQNQPLENLLLDPWKYLKDSKVLDKSEKSIVRIRKLAVFFRWFLYQPPKFNSDFTPEEKGDWKTIFLLGFGNFSGANC